MTKARKRLTKEETRKRILETSYVFFKKFGYAKTTVGDIARELRMSSANIYKFFSSKDAIIESIGDLIVDEFTKDIEAIAALKGKVLGRMEEIFLHSYLFHKKKLNLDTQLYKLVLRSHEEDWKCNRDSENLMIRALSGLIEEGIKKSEFRKVDSLSTAKVILDSFTWITHPLLFYKLDHAGVESRLHRQILFIGEALK